MAQDTMKHSYARLNCPRPDNCQAEDIDHADPLALRGTTHHAPEGEYLPVSRPKRIWLDDLAKRQSRLRSAIEEDAPVGSAQ